MSFQHRRPVRPLGINPQHPAVILGGVPCLATTFPDAYDFMTGRFGQYTGTHITQTPDLGLIGGSTTNGTLSASDNVTFSGMPSLGSTLTVGMIFVATQVTTAMTAFISSGNNTSFDMRINNPNLNLFISGVGTANTGVAVTAGVPYFAACSSSNGLVASTVLLRNLLSGTITSNVSGRVTTDGNGTFMVGGNGGSRSFQGQIAMCAAFPVYLGLDGLLAWAADPWGLFLEARPRKFYFANPAGSGAAPSVTYPQLERFGHRGAFRGMLH